MAKVQITFDSENISKPPHVKVDGKPVEFLHNISFDWNTRTIEKDTIAGSLISRQHPHLRRENCSRSRVAILRGATPPLA